MNINTKILKSDQRDSHEAISVGEDATQRGDSVLVGWVRT